MPDYSHIIDFCTRDELGALLLDAIRVDDVAFAAALREAIKQRKDRYAPQEPLRENKHGGRR